MCKRPVSTMPNVARPATLVPPSILCNLLVDGATSSSEITEASKTDETHFVSASLKLLDFRVLTLRDPANRCRHTHTPCLTIFAIV